MVKAYIDSSNSMAENILKYPYRSTDDSDLLRAFFTICGNQGLCRRCFACNLKAMSQEVLHRYEDLSAC
jgi:hypothetical protein